MAKSPVPPIAIGAIGIGTDFLSSTKFMVEPKKLRFGKDLNDRLNLLN